ncbi:DUF4865 family protein [Nocardioides sp. MAHUQ-72]|uniref:DUF4865 family protein n=1 Tax=unclassified Nocardioides TaxID=2615069 RepID=UPI00360AD3A0
MAAIGNRVATKGHALDNYPGLGLKAYLVRDVSTRAPVNAYAPLHLWAHEAAIGLFLWGGDGFGGIVRDPGRPAVPTWLGGATGPGRPTARCCAGRSRPRTRSRSISTHRLPPNRHPPHRLLGEDELHSAMWAIDPRSWELLGISLRVRRRYNAGAEPGAHLPEAQP